MTSGLKQVVVAQYHCFCWCSVVVLQVAVSWTAKSFWQTNGAKDSLHRRSLSYVPHLTPDCFDSPFLEEENGRLNDSYQGCHHPLGTWAK